MTYLRLPLALGAAGLLAFASPLGATALADEPSTAPDSACEVTSLHPFTQGHQDMALVDSGSGFDFLVRDDASGRDYHAGEFYVELGSEAELSPNAAASLPSGFPTSGWAVPQTQDPAVPWLGFNTSYVSDTASVTGATLTMELGSAPAGGRVVGFQTDVQGSPTVLFDSEDPSITWDFPDHAHAHTGMIFTEPGVYAVAFSFELGSGDSYSLDVPFVVGGGSSADEVCELEWPDATGGPADKNDANLSRPKRITKEINDTAKALGGLDKELDKTRKEAEKMVGAASSSTTAPRRQAQKPAARAGQDSQPRPAGGASPSSQGAQALQKPDRKSAPKNDAADKNGVKKDAAQKGGAQKDTAQATPYNNEEIRAMSYQEPMTSFWAGVLAGMGVFATILGVGLFIWVQFFRQR
ncbi:choice-of-anchor M domain-containing protein [Corynebacterium sp.]|uniref:choice-of-anchor M domain-containing protein n=1 Tax=Corynebacterium sp. TaxID=1720 RepID=UPI0026DA9425|nr:choice-of-anchor M domain-containing protein [Corynebacterium sp.]MDO5031480.1 choice-of-anchor M domain-containing protein [Corynebacterium sp.]